MSRSVRKEKETAEAVATPNKDAGEEMDTVMEENDNAIVELERLQTVGINMG
jgi:hypothetical protein